MSSWNASDLRGTMKLRGSTDPLPPGNELQAPSRLAAHDVQPALGHEARALGGLGRAVLGQSEGPRLFGDVLVVADVAVALALLSRAPACRRRSRE